MNTAKEFIVNKTPREYLKQGTTHCGVYTVKAILSAYGKDDKSDPEDYHFNSFGRILGSSTSEDIIKILKNYDINAEVKSASKASDKLSILIDALKKGNPVIIRIGNGYKDNGEYSVLQANLFGHWISVWGYNNEEKVFYVYDASISKEKYDVIPVGNKKRTFDEILRDWSMSGLLQPWMWGKTFVYIQIS